MDIELKLGDKVWMHYGPSTIIVGHIIDYSPDFSMIGMSPLPYDEYKQMTLLQKASVPMSWCETKFCHYMCHITYDDLKKMDEAANQPKVGFGGAFASV